MNLATLIRNLFVTALVVAATAAVISLQRTPEVQQGASSFFWILYAIAVGCALVVLIHREPV